MKSVEYSFTVITPRSTDPEELYLLESYLWIKQICVQIIYIR